MADETPATIVVPTMQQRLLQLVADKVATAAATLLIGAGVVAPAGETQFVAVISGVLVGAATLAWNYFQQRRHDARLRAAVVAPASVPVTK